MKKLAFLALALAGALPAHGQTFTSEAEKLECSTKLAELFRKQEEMPRLLDKYLAELRGAGLKELQPWQLGQIDRNKAEAETLRLQFRATCPIGKYEWVSTAPREQTPPPPKIETPKADEAKKCSPLPSGRGIDCRDSAGRQVQLTLCFQRGDISHWCETDWHDFSRNRSGTVRHEGDGPLPSNWVAFFEKWRP